MFKLPHQTTVAAPARWAGWMRCAAAGALCVAAAAVSAQTPASAVAAAPAARSATLAPSLQLAGQGQMRFLGLRIYDARLWVDPAFEAAAFERYPLALELHYHRAFSGAAIAQRSVQEIRRQHSLDEAQAERWTQALAKLLPDVQADDRLTGVYLPGQGMQLWRGAQLLGELADAELARYFFGIWLAPQTSEPRLRQALLAGLSASAP